LTYKNTATCEQKCNQNIGSLENIPFFSPKNGQNRQKSVKIVGFKIGPRKTFIKDAYLAILVASVCRYRQRNSWTRCVC
jgi:hypothetical protein